VSAAPREAAGTRHSAHPKERRPSP
jgi:hypothetical protein